MGELLERPVNPKSKVKSHARSRPQINQGDWSKDAPVVPHLDGALQRDFSFFSHKFIEGLVTNASLLFFLTFA